MAMPPLAVGATASSGSGCTSQWRQFAGIADEFDLHELAVEDAVTAHQRPKLDRYDDTLSWCSRPSAT